MLLYSIRKIFLFFVTLLMLTLISFSIMRLDVNSSYADSAFLFGWIDYLNALSQGDWGLTYNGIPVAQKLLHAYPATIELCVFAFSIAMLLGIPFGIIAGIYRGYHLEKAISSITLLAYSIPIFVLAILLTGFFSLETGLLPVSGRYNLLYEIPQITGFAIIDVLLSDLPERKAILQNIINHLIMPALVLSIAPMTEIINLLRDSVADVMTKNYIKAAATRGFSRTKIIFRHVIKNALPPVLPKFGVQISAVMTFAIITESIFDWPGIGSWLLSSLELKDYASVQAGVLAMGTTVLFFTILFDLLSAAISPLVRKEWYAIEQ